MKSIILYGSRYGSTHWYAQALSRQTGVPAVSWKEAPSLEEQDRIVYLGALYAGGVLGLAKTLRGLRLREGQTLIVATVGLSDPALPETRATLRRALEQQIPHLCRQAKVFHLRGAIDYGTLSLPHRTMMALLVRALRRKPESAWSQEDRALVETYGQKVDFRDAAALAPILAAMQEEPGGSGAC